MAGAASDRHGQREQARPEAADRGRRVEITLEEERAPALEAALDDEADQRDEPEREERARDAWPGRRLRPARLAAAVGEAGRGDQPGHGHQDPALPRPPPPWEPR